MYLCSSSILSRSLSLSTCLSGLRGKSGRDLILSALCPMLFACTTDSFRIYDIDGDGSIDRSVALPNTARSLLTALFLSSRNELYQLLKAALSENLFDLTDDQIHILVDDTFAQVDSNGLFGACLNLSILLIAPPPLVLHHLQVMVGYPMKSMNTW